MVQARQGYSDGSFGPDNTITRAEFVTMAMRFAGVSSTAGKAGFPDVDSAHWAAGYIASAVNGGYISGYPDGSFGPNNQITRAEAVTILNKIRGCASLDQGKSFTDVPVSHWAYKAITAAATGHTHSMIFVDQYEIFIPRPPFVIAGLTCNPPPHSSLRA